MRRSLLGLSVLCLAGPAGCAVSSAHDLSWETRPEAVSARAEIEELGRRFSAAYLRGDVDAMAALYTPAAVISPNNSEAIRGREAIHRYWTLRPGERITHHRAMPTEIRIDGDHAYDHGVYEVSGARNGETWGPSHGKYVIVWRREGEGWRMHLDMWNSRPQPRP